MPHLVHVAVAACAIAVFAVLATVREVLPGAAFRVAQGQQGLYIIPLRRQPIDCVISLFEIYFK
jgi:hypothetical protein